MVGMIGQWVEGPRVNLTDNFVKDELGKYLFSSVQKSGPIYSASVLPNYYEDLDEIEPQNYEEIRSTIKRNYDLLVGEDLADVVKQYVKMKGLYNTTTSIEGIGENKDETLKALKEALNEEKDSGAISDFKIKAGKDKFNVTIFQNIDGRVKDLKRKSFRETFVNFDYDFDVKVDEVSEVALLVDNKLMMEIDDLPDGVLKVDNEWNPASEGMTGVKFTYEIEGDAKNNLDFIASRNTEDYLNVRQKFFGAEGEKQRIKRPAQRLILPSYRIAPETFAQFKVNAGTLRNYIREQFIDDLGHYLTENKFALLPKFVNDITVEGTLKYDGDEIHPIFHINVTTKSAYNFLEKKDIARPSKERESKISGGTGKPTKFTRQYHPKTYNKDRDKFAAHVVGRMNRLEELW